MIDKKQTCLVSTQLRTPEQIKLLRVYNEFVTLETAPTLEQENEVNEALNRLSFICDATAQIEVMIQTACSNIRRSRYSGSITNKIKIRVIDDMIDYLTILKNEVKFLP